MINEAELSGAMHIGRLLMRLGMFEGLLVNVGLIKNMPISMLLGRSIHRGFSCSLPISSSTVE